MSHLDEGTLHAMLDGELSGDEAAKAQAHLDGCARCTALMVDAREFLAEADTLVESLDEPAAPAAPAANWYRRPQVLALAATVAVAIGASYLAFQASPDIQPAFRAPTSVALDTVALGEAEPQSTNLEKEAIVGGVASDSDPKSDGGLRAVATPERANAPAPVDADDATPQVAAEPLVLQEEAAPGKDVDAREQQLNAPAAPALEAERGAKIEAVDELAREDKARDSVAAKRTRDAGNEFADVADGPAESAALSGMVQTLGGSIRLIDGKQAVRYEQVPAPELEGIVRGDLVRVVYHDDEDREFLLEQLRLTEGEEEDRLQLEQAAEPDAGRRESALLSISTGDTVVSREADDLVRIQWIDGDFILSLVGADEAYLRSQMEHVR